MEDSEYINIHWSLCRIPRILLGFTSNIFFISKLIIYIVWCHSEIENCCLLLFGVINNRVYNDDAFRTFTFSMQQSVSFTYQLPWQKQIRIILLILDFKLGTVDNRKDYLQTWGEFFSFIIYFFYIKTGIRDFLLNIYSAYTSFAWTAAIGLEVSGSNNIVSILPLH